MNYLNRILQPLHLYLLQTDRIVEAYQCCRCDVQFSEEAKPTKCPSCGHLYVKWLTYNENFGKTKGILKDRPIDQRIK